MKEGGDMCDVSVASEERRRAITTHSLNDHHLKVDHVLIDNNSSSMVRKVVQVG